MKTISLSVIAASLVLAMPVWADDAHHPPQGEAAPAAQAPAAQPTPQADAKALATMQSNLNRMRAQLDRLGKARTPEERRKIIAEHMQAMQQSMDMARGMQGGMMSCPMMSGGMMSQGGMGMMGPGMSGNEDMMMKRLEMMEKRMDMMQMMMQSRMGTPAAEAAKPGN